MKRFLFMATALLFGMSARAWAEGTDAKGIEFFETKIRPVLVTHCFECHSAKAKKLKGKLLLDTRAGIFEGGESGHAVVPGNLQESLLLEAIRYDSLEMPPKKKLPDSVIADFEQWIRMGAPDPRDGNAAPIRKSIDFEQARKFWSFRPPEKRTTPRVNRTDWPRMDIDRFILSRLENEGLEPVEDADRRTLIRRATFDLTGLPPTPEEIEAFVNDSSPKAFETLVDRLLASPRFGERWGRHWLDVARYAESTGKERNYAYTHAWRYRDYVIASFESDKPYDRFVLEQVAGDLLPAESEQQANEQLIATGFLALGPKSLNEKVAERFLMQVVDDQIDSTCRAVLGLTVGCARCHDHKFDPIPTSDYYALAGIFRSTVTLSGTGYRKGKNSKGQLFPLGRNGRQQLEAFQEQRKKLDRLRSQIKKAAKKAAVKSRSSKKRKNSKEDKKAEQELKRLNAELQARQEKLPEMAMAVHDSTNPADCQICIRGEVEDRGPLVPRGFVSVLTTGQSPTIDPTHSGRLELAHWLASSENPLTARVMVNRIWLHLFGAGLVRTVDNFGALGDRPSHPDLLDYLAVRFMEEGWSVKRAIRGIMLSRAYQLSSNHDPENNEVDPENRLLWRMSRRRLDADSIRDVVLAVSGKLDLAPPWGSIVMKLGDGEFGRGIDVKTLMTESAHRSIYLPIVRGVLPDMLRVFDGADPSLVVGRRDVTTVATQALFMMNSPFLIAQSKHLARRLLAKSTSGDARRVDWAYRLAFGRPATKVEQQRVLDFLADYIQTMRIESDSKTNRSVEAWTSFCQALFSSAEFRYVY